MDTVGSRAAVRTIRGGILRRVMAPLAFGLVYDMPGSYPRRASDPPDAEAEYEPEATVRALEDAVRRLGHRPVRIGSPRDLLTRIGRDELPDLDVALTIAEGHGGRNREAWAPVLLEMAEIPALGSDALTLSLTLDKAWACAVVAAAGVPVPAGAFVRSGAEAVDLELGAAFPWFVKPRWEGSA